MRGYRHRDALARHVNAKALDMCCFLCDHHTDPVVKKVMQNKRFWAVLSISVIFFSVIGFANSEYRAQDCVTSTIMKQIEFAGTPDAAVPPVVKENMDSCVYVWSMRAALFLGFSSVAAATLGAILSNRSPAGPSTNMSAHYEPDSRKLVLRFDRPTIVPHPQRMVLLYHHADGMATTVPGRQCGDDGLALAFTTDMEKPPILMELVIYSKAMHPAGFPKSDVCAGGRPIHIDVDIVHCDT